MTVSPTTSVLADARSRFDLPDGVTYMNCAFMGPMPLASIEAGTVGLARKARPWTIEPDDFTAPVDRLRAGLADLLGVPGDVDGVAVTPSVSYGVATAAANVTLEPGQVAVVLHKQFPSDVYGWEALADRCGASLHAVDPPDDGDWTAALLATIDELGARVGLVSAPPCHWIDGASIDLVAVSAAARAVGAVMAVDVCQSLGAVPFEVDLVRPDFVFGATYKWLLGPYSVGFLWVAPHRRDGVPIEQGWTGRANSHCLACLADYTREYQPGARRFDVGEVANFALVPAATVSIDLIRSWSPAVIAAHAGAITARVAGGVEALGLHVAPAHLRAPHILGVRLGPDVDAEALAPALAAHGVHVSVRGDAVRVSAHAFNTLEDADRLVAALDATVG